MDQIPVRSVRSKMIIRLDEAHEAPQGEPLPAGDYWVWAARDDDFIDGHWWRFLSVVDAGDDGAGRPFRVIDTTHMSRVRFDEDETVGVVDAGPVEVEGW